MLDVPQQMALESKPIFQPEVLRQQVRAFNLSERAGDWQPKLQHWAGLIASGRADDYKETALLPDFLRDIFCGLLGYTGPVCPADTHNPHLPDTGPAAFADTFTFSRERHVEVDGKVADAVLGRFHKDKEQFVAILEGQGARDPLAPRLRGGACQPWTRRNCPFCEDRGLLPAESLKHVFEHRDPYNPRPVRLNFWGRFRAIDEGNAGLNIPAYNGGLFDADPALDVLQVPDEVSAHFKDLGDYDYRPAREVADADENTEVRSVTRTIEPARALAAETSFVRAIVSREFHQLQGKRQGKEPMVANSQTYLAGICARSALSCLAVVPIIYSHHDCKNDLAPRRLIGAHPRHPSSLGC
jgi:hypothetical protein